MLHLFCPNYRCARISEIPITWLEREGVKAIILDLDNTLLPWDANTPSAENVSWGLGLSDDEFVLEEIFHEIINLESLWGVSPNVPRRPLKSHSRCRIPPT